MNLPSAFTANVIRIWGQEGKIWLDQLPKQIAYFATLWNLTDIKHFNNLSFNYVAHAYSNQYKQSVVLKIGVPTPQFLNELNALKFYKGNGAAHLLAYDIQKYGMLLQRIAPGTTIRELFPKHDQQAVEYACHVMHKLHSLPIKSSNFATIDSWFLLFDTLKIPHGLQKSVDKARIFVKDLKTDSQPQHLLHGDLHHDNILLDVTKHPIAIDPKGVIGEAAYEVGAFMCNPEELSSQPKVPELLESRINQFSKLLGIDRLRLAKACYARIILSACWTVEANGNWHDDALFAEYINKSFINPSYFYRDLD